MLAKELLFCLINMLHYHQGSQIPDLNTIRRGIEEAANLLGIGERTLYRKIKEYGLK